MTPSISQHPTDADLLAWLSGDNSQTQHIIHCQMCLERARSLYVEEQFLSANLARVDCPTALELGEYEMGIMAISQRRQIAAHVAHCPHCQQELATLKAFFAMTPLPEPAASLSEQLRVVVATLIQDLRDEWQGTAGMQPAMAAMRGNDQGPQIYKADNYQLSIALQEDPANPGRRALFGLLIGDDDPSVFEVQLWQDQTLFAQAAVDEFGNFRISGLADENYDLKLIKPELEIHLEAIPF